MEHVLQSQITTLVSALTIYSYIAIASCVASIEDWQVSLIKFLPSKILLAIATKVEIYAGRFALFTELNVFTQHLATPPIQCMLYLDIL